MSNEVRRLRSVLAGERPGGRDGEATRQQLSKAYQDFAAIYGYAEQASASIRRLRLADPVGLDELVGALRRDVAAIEYAIVEDRLVSAVLKNEDISIANHGAWSSIRILVEAFVVSCSSPTSEQAVLRLAQEMYDFLVSPLERSGSLLNAVAVVVVAPNELGAVPFEALCCNEKFLFERFPISYLPSLSINRSLNALAPLRRGLVLGDPDGSLVHARREAREVGALVPTLVGGRPMIGADATLETLKRYAADSDLVHIASHADFSEEAAAFSAIVLADGEIGKNANLEVRDVLQLRLADSLIVLSGCTTGAAAANSSNEYIGFVRGFLSAGASGIVASRWAVQDSSTLEFMRHFYYSLVSEEASPIVALQNARRDQIALGGYRHPRHWAAFGFFGRPDV
jgi:CHAT domain-containing protein